MPLKTPFAFCAALAAASNGDTNCQQSTSPDDENALLQLARSSETMSKTSPAQALLQSVSLLTEKVKAGDDPNGCQLASDAAQEAVTAGLDAIRAQHSHQVNQVSIAAASVETCASRTVDGLDFVTTQGTNLVTARNEHAQCRHTQATNIGAQTTACEAWAAHRNGLGNQVCHSYPQADSSAAWVTAAETAKGLADAAWSEGKDLQEACATAGTAADNSETECETKQEQFERDYCAHRASCADLQICRATAEENFLAVRSEVEDAMVDIEAEFLVMKHAECLLTQVHDALNSETHTEIISDAACDTPASTTELSITWPEFETLDTCDDTILTRPPCEAAYLEAEYGALPDSLRETIADACTSCSPLPIADAPVSWVRQLGYIDLSNIVPADGSPSGCECTVVELSGEFSPGPLVKCMNCITTYRSTDANSCPSGFKIYSPRSQQDWQTLMASGWDWGSVRRPHHIMDITRPHNGCGGCTGHVMNSDTPAQSSWVTSDGSPWFLRNRGYSEPNGDYTHNCYLDMWQSPESDGNVRFNDGSCHYHSNSYYCQLAADAQVVASLPEPQTLGECTLLTSVDTHGQANQGFWANQCQSIPASATMVRVNMGSVVDYFKPTPGHSLCQMLQSNTLHQWSPDGESWITPPHYGGHLGGSQAHWPNNNVDGDQRTYLSFWGTGGASGRCCHASYNDGAAWHQAFTMSYC